MLRSAAAERRGSAVAADRMKAKLKALLRRHNHRYVRYSEALKNAEQLLVQMQAARPRRHRLEEKHTPYKSGKCDWLKWKKENKGRGNLFAGR
jgi:hypothetical protein